MTRHDLNYYFEHKMLPKLFFEEKENFIKFVLGRNQHGLFEMHRDLFESQGETMPYAEEDYDVRAVKPRDHTLAVILTPPEPEEIPLCYYIIMIFDLDFKDMRYFTLEKGESFVKRGGTAFLCGWDANGNHLNYGEHPVDEMKALFRCLEISGIELQIPPKK